MRDQQLDGAPWYLDLELAKLVLRTVLPGRKGGIHLCSKTYRTHSNEVKS